MSVLVVVRWVDTEVVGQSKNLLVHRSVQGFCASLLEIRPTATSNQQRVPGEGDALLVHDVSHAA